jgi:hypothetical protein
MTTYKIDEGFENFKKLIKDEEDLFKLAAEEILAKGRFAEMFSKNQGAKILDVAPSDAKF